ncbi:peptide-methionine (S)-S-oxide reductase MsrA [Mangrovimonas sp. YM274]|uniref:peptide-methionine (S)-S-oxide reductase MsrA n=1 Tax=Mangrovimonas sp. YM274 TaxID=3070660 RepID=UPI0027DAE790|nr:peptide-methionine (S)-S-oxide reductase MsrA [Mangrovimonas sp. YM274]WMI68539.1 peptide-methionine (S)-S-oxide reductase MsrA [Mangrovimonas sp. YM274]
MNNNQYEIATLGGGCFWCTEAVFQELEGVETVVSGYMGGSVPGTPTYREVCSGLTGHAEVVQVTFNPSKVTFKELLEVFMTTHNPTTLNQQGADVGTQYRSVIFYHDDSQKQIAEEVLRDMAQYFESPIVTEITELQVFHKAEDYHQNYYRNNPDQGYCSFVIAPKLSKLRQMFQSKLKSKT